MMEKIEPLIIKNMVCPRCISAVETILTDLKIEFTDVQLGEVKLSTSVDETRREILANNLQSAGFQLILSESAAAISKIKALIVQRIHFDSAPLRENFSVILASELHANYSGLSRLFSATQGMTIEKYIALQKIEKVKEMLMYDENSLSEIAYQMHYSSPAYLSTQFKRETGMTPTEFKAAQEYSSRKSIDSI